MKNKQMFGNLLLILGAFVWGMAFAFQRAGMESIEPITFTSARMALAALAAGSAALFLRKRAPETESPAQSKARRRATVLGGIVCGLFLTAASICQQTGLVTTSAGKAGFVTALYILLVPLLNLILFKKRCGVHVWIAIAIGVAGLYFLCMKEDFTLAPGDIQLCICALLFSGQILACAYYSRRGDPVCIAAIQLLTVAVISGVLAFIAEEPGWDKLRAAAVPILYCGIMSGGVGYTLQMVAQRYTDPTVASLLMSLESVFAVLGGALLLHERLSGRELLGCVIMFIAIILVQIPMPKRERALSAE